MSVRSLVIFLAAGLHGAFLCWVAASAIGDGIEPAFVVVRIAVAVVAAVPVATFIWYIGSKPSPSSLTPVEKVAAGIVISLASIVWAISFGALGLL